MRQKTIITKSVHSEILKCSEVKESVLQDAAKKLLYLAQNFEKELPGIENLKNQYIP